MLQDGLLGDKDFTLRQTAPCCLLHCMQTKMEAKLRELISTLEAKGLEHVRLTAELENRSEHTVNWLQ
jgi:hypothetical protein